MSGAAPAEGEDARGPGDDQGEPQAEGGEEGEVEDDAPNGAGTEDGAAPGANPLLGGPALMGAAEWIADPESVDVEATAFSPRLQLSWVIELVE